MHVPDKYVVLKLTQQEKIHKLFCIWESNLNGLPWNGSYIDTDYWRLNSGIARVEKDGHYYLFHGYSNSVYACHEYNYGLSSYGISILDSWERITKGLGDIKIRILEDHDWVEYFKEHIND
jgi:hypothetical protein